MKNAPNLYDTLTHIFGQHQHWLDKRHFHTLAWMIVGLIESGLISLTAWAPVVDSRANFAQSTVRRFRRWLANERIQVRGLTSPAPDTTVPFDPADSREHGTGERRVGQLRLTQRLNRV